MAASRPCGAEGGSSRGKSGVVGLLGDQIPEPFGNVGVIGRRGELSEQGQVVHRMFHVFVVLGEPRDHGAAGVFENVLAQVPAPALLVLALVHPDFLVLAYVGELVEALWQRGQRLLGAAV
ncbi:hypothetical protein [Streptomyces tauricus]|uniref:hypothetical protein n=1 Tax=Streptomyces tauricus TaxID=68274 RepID=UPI0033B10105